MKNKLTLLILLIFSLNAYAQKVSRAEVEKVALNVLKRETINRSDMAVKKVTSISSEGIQDLMHIVEYPEGGFSIISGDKAAPAVLGFCESGQYDPENMPSGLLYLMERYEYELKALRADKIAVTEEIKQQWSTTLSDNQLQLRSSSDWRDFLLETQWTQSHNKFCPGDNYPAGCVAVAMAQILRYWACRVTPSGSCSYKWNNKTLSADFGATTYNWSDMHLVNKDDENQRLIYHAGVSCKMDYGANGSSSNTTKARDAFVKYWGFQSKADVQRRFWHLRTWKDKLIEEIKNGRPICYGGQRVDGIGLSGHEWVIDGYRANGKFHCNFGWGGKEDDFNGWYSLGDWHPNPENNPYNQFENAILYLEPNQPQQVGSPQMKSYNFKFSTDGYTLSVEPVYGATSYEWITDNGTISGTGNSVTLYSPGTSKVKVRAYNALCDIYSPYSSNMIGITSGPFITGDYNEGTNNEKTYFIQNMIPGARVNWSLTNYVDFEIVDRWDNYVKIRSNSYNKEATLTANIPLQGINNIVLSKQVVSERWDICGTETMSCAETEYLSSVIYNGTENIRWTCSKSIEITSDNALSKIKAKGIVNDKNGWIEMELTHNGKVYTKRKRINVLLPYDFGLSIQNLWVENGKRCALIKANPTPYVRYNYFAYRWFIISKGMAKGTIKPCADDPRVITIDREQFNVIAERKFDYKEVISSEEIGGRLHDDIIGFKNTEDSEVRFITKTEISEKVDEPAIVLEVTKKQSALQNVETESKYVVLEKEKSTPEYSLPYTPLPDIPVVPVDDPSYAIAIFPLGVDVTISCRFTTPCNEIFNASITIPGYSYGCSYNSTTQTIYVDREGEDGDNEVTKLYKATLFNEYGIIKTVSFNSNEKLISLPVNDIPNGGYYVNIMDENNNIIDSQYVPVK